MGELHLAAALRAFELGKAAVARQDWPLAIAALSEVLVLEPDNTELYPLLMKAAMAVKNYKLAGALIIQAAEHAPEAMHAMEPYFAGLPSKRPARLRATGQPSVDPAKTVYQLKITLKYLSPPVWRRVLVKSNITLEKLHYIIQAVMGWHNSHLHEFETSDGERYGSATGNDDMFGMHVKSEKRAKLGAVLTEEKQRLVYTYDFGDDWEHAVVLEKILPADPGQRYPVCVKGKRATPPDDVGGLPGYITFLEALADPKHEDHEMYAEWIGHAFDPEAFDIEEANAALRRIR
ncbi:MAG TPA: plasmid pRiA4b ORF-3 family protein [Armatimonadota bacterium]|jgi:hypothetical protein